MHHRHLVEVPVRRRAGGVVPLQRRGLPRVARRRLAPDPASDEVDDERDLRDPQRKGAVGDELVHRLILRERRVVQVLRDPPREPADAQDVHREERPVEEDEAEPEVDDEDPEVVDDDQLMRAPEPDPQYGGTLRTAYGITVSHFDFHQGGGGPLVMAFDNLIALNMTDGFDTIVGELAVDWNVSEDGTVYTFNCREGVEFHDGTPFSAEDVVATYERVIFPPEGISSPQRENFVTVEEVNLVDEFTMEFVLENPWPPFIQALTEVPMVIYSKQHLEENDYDMRDVIAPGTGAFIHSELETAERWTFERNPNYWNPNLPYVDGLEMLHVPAWPDRGTDILTDQADFSWNVSMELHEEGLERSDFVQTRVLPHFGASYHFVINNSREPFDDPRVRRAIHLAVSRQNLIAAFARQEFITMNRWISHANNYAMPIEEFQDMPGYREDKEEDIAEARQLMEEAGYPDGFEAEIMSADVAPHAQIMAPAFQDELLTSLNIQTTISVLERALLTDYLNTGDYDFQLSVAFGTGMPDPETMWAKHLRTDASQNFTRFSNAEFDELLDRIKLEEDEEERERLFHQGMDILDEDPPFLMIGFADHLPMWKNNVHGIVENWNHTQWGRLQTVWMSDE
jgi:peptide/nickel transport system substrate-binding protein